MILGGLVLMTACKKENPNEMVGIPEGAILLTTEGYTNAQNNTKTSVLDETVQWVDGDQLILYIGTERNTPTVTVSDGNAYIGGELAGSGIMHAYYAATPNDYPGSTYTPYIKIPAEYSCSVSGGRQVIALPMVANASSDATYLRFRHLTAAINVVLRNSVGSVLYVDSVILSSDSYYLNKGSKQINMNNVNNDDFDLTTETGDDAASKRVKVSFSSGFEVPVSSESKSIQVPIMPIGADYMTIEVYCHSDAKHYHYSYKPSSMIPALGRNQMLDAKVDLNTSGHMEEVVASRMVDLSTISADFEAQDGDILTGTPNTKTYIYCTISGGTVTLQNVNASSKFLYLRATDDATIILSGSNTLSGGETPVHVSAGHELTIQGDGSLTVSSTGYNRAAIGSWGSNPCGNIVIKGGNITANAGTTGSAAGIGCGGANNCGSITIEGGNVIAKGSGNAAGIGTSGNTLAHSCGAITITSGITQVKAIKGSTSATACIGKGISSSTINGDITIDGTTSWTPGTATTNLNFVVSTTTNTNDTWTLTPITH